MKPILIMSLVMATVVSATAQNNFVPGLSSPKSISAPPIAVTVNKTTNLVFPFKVKNVDRGLEALLVQTVEGAEHILQIKAANTQMAETNLSVVTADLQLYVFLVRYDSSPAVLNYDLRKDSNRVVFGSNSCWVNIRENLSDGEIQRSAEIVAGKKPYLKRTSDYAFGAQLKLNGIYVNRDVLFLSLQLENGTAIDYSIESLQVSIQDQKKNKLTATQELLIPRRYAWGDTTMIESHTGQRLILAVSKFTIPDKKQCKVQLREANGGRHLDLIFGNRLLMRAKEIE